MIRSYRLPLIAIAALAIPTAACSFSWSSDDGDAVPAQGSGNVRTFAARDFTGVDLRGSDPVEVRVGGGYSVRAEGPADTLDQLQIERDGATLRIGRKKGTHWGWSKGKGVRILVTLPRLADAGVSGSGRMTIDRVEGAASVSLMGSGSADLGPQSTCTVSKMGSGSARCGR